MIITGLPLFHVTAEQVVVNDVFCVEDIVHYPVLMNQNFDGLTVSDSAECYVQLAVRKGLGSEVDSHDINCLSLALVYCHGVCKLGGNCLRVIMSGEPLMMGNVN